MRFPSLPALLLVLPLGTLSAQSPGTATRQATSSPPQPAASMRGPRDSAEVVAFLDGLMTAWMRDKHIAGVTVSVVREGKLLMAKGYGYADVATRKPVDPATTMFRIGSVSKLFTWTGVMQLHELGKLDLTKDVNAYIDFKIPATYTRPITLTDILTHTPGLEEDGRDLFTEDSAHITPMGRWLPAHMPRRVRPPATFASYSNWGAALAGYIVERVGGDGSWDVYTEKRIFQPLGMRHSTTRQPLPAQFANDMSIGYQWKDGQFLPQKFELITGAAPAGSIGASATDMANFMIAHLNRGTLGNTRILGEPEAVLMQTRIRGHDARIPGFAHGFYEQSSHGLRILGHGGDTQWFHSSLSIIPSEQVGVFMSTNTSTGSAISFEPFLTAFLDHYYPEQVPLITPDSAAKVRVRRYAGEYLFNRMNFSTYQKALSLAGSIPVRAMDDGTLLVSTPFGGLRMVEVDSSLFREVNSGALIAFSTGANGKIAHGYLALAPFMVMDKVSALSAPSLHRMILGSGLLLFLAVVATAVIRFSIRNTPGRPRVPVHVTNGRRALALAGALMIAFVGVLAFLASNPARLLSDTPTALKVGLTFPVVAALLVVWAAWEMVAQWRSGEGSIWMRLRHTGAVLIALTFIWSLHTWNLLGWRM